MADEHSVVSAPAVPGTSSGAPLVVPRAQQRDFFTRRFVIVYASLAAICVGSITALLVFGAGVGFGGGHAWSSWKPHSGSLATVAKQIADHVAPNYKLG